MRSGFVTLIGRPNVGKSTLLNQIVDTKVAITSDKPQTTRSQVRGVLHRSVPVPAPGDSGPEDPGTEDSGTEDSGTEDSGAGATEDVQVVFVDTPGIHKPKGPLGGRLNQTATDALRDVDVACVVVDATATIGPGDRWVADLAPPGSVLVLNKIDAVKPGAVLEALARCSELDFAEYFPVSARTGDGVDALVDHLVAAMPEGPPYYPEGMVTDVPEAFWVAELVREQLLARLRDELPHSIAVRVVEWAWPRIRVEILVERESQKGIVIGKGGRVLKEVGTAVRWQLKKGAHLELHVVVDDSWSGSGEVLDSLGY